MNLYGASNSQLQNQGLQLPHSITLNSKLLIDYFNLEKARLRFQKLIHYRDRDEAVISRNDYEKYWSNKTTIFDESC